MKREEVLLRGESESAAVSTVAAIEEAFHDESRNITSKRKTIAEKYKCETGTFFNVYQDSDCYSSSSHINSKLENIDTRRMTSIYQ